MSEIVMRRVTVRGRVQGVGFRAYVEDAALLNGVHGWVRNRRDGAVEAVLAGTPKAVATVIAACRQGPGAARVDAIDDVPAGPDDLKQRPAGETFAVLPTA